MKLKIIYAIITLSLLLIPTVSATNLQLFSEGRLFIEEFIPPDDVCIDESFIVNVTIRNERFIPVRVKVTINALDGLLETIKKNIGEHFEAIIPGRSRFVLPIPCVLTKGDYDWYKEKYNLQASLSRKRLIVGWVNQDSSSPQGIHVHTPLSDKIKLSISSIDTPEHLSEGQNSFTTYITIKNNAPFDFDIYAKVSYIRKPSILPELDQVNIESGFISEKFELGRTEIIQIIASDQKTIPVECYLREHQQDLKELSVQTQIYVCIDGTEYLVESSSLEGILYKQSFIEQEGLNLFLILLGSLIIILLIVVIYRIVYPAYYIKRHKLQEEKQRIERHRRFHS